MSHEYHLLHREHESGEMVVTLDRCWKCGLIRRDYRGRGQISVPGFPRFFAPGYIHEFSGKEPPCVPPGLRDSFAGQALMGFQAFVRGGWSGTIPKELADNMASNCYAIADAMIAERQKPKDVEHG